MGREIAPPPQGKREVVFRDTHDTHYLRPHPLSMSTLRIITNQQGVFPTTLEGNCPAGFEVIRSPLISMADLCAVIATAAIDAH